MLSITCVTVKEIVSLLDRGGWCMLDQNINPLRNF